MKKEARRELRAGIGAITVGAFILLAGCGTQTIGSSGSNPVAVKPASSTSHSAGTSSVKKKVSSSKAAHRSTRNVTSACVVGALGVVPVANGGGASFPPAEAAPAGSSPLSESNAVTIALQEAAQFGGTPAAPTTAPTAASEMAYSSFLTLSGWSPNPSINAQRCVWVISVHAPIAEKGAPGAPARTDSEYTVALDVASGTLVGLIEGEALVG